METHWKPLWPFFPPRTNFQVLSLQSDDSDVWGKTAGKFPHWHCTRRRQCNDGHSIDEAINCDKKHIRLHFFLSGYTLCLPPAFSSSFAFAYCWYFFSSIHRHYLTILHTYNNNMECLEIRTELEIDIGSASSPFSPASPSSSTSWSTWMCQVYGKDVLPKMKFPNADGSSELK